MADLRIEQLDRGQRLQRLWLRWKHINLKSTSGYVFTYGGGAISWRSKLQECRNLSTTKTEYIAGSEAAKEVIWLHRLWTNFLAKRRIDHIVPTIYCDSQSAIHRIRNSIYHAKKENIEVWFHHIRKLTIENKLGDWKIDIEVNIGGFLMKLLLEKCFGALRTMIGLRQAT